MTTFHEAITDALDYEPLAWDTDAARVLGMSEMVAIKATLRHFGHVCCWTRGDKYPDEVPRHLAIQGLPQNVIDWVMS